jgi:PDDEXK-like domain of unknown function (DUF3799)
MPADQPDLEPEFPGVYTGLPEAQYHAHPALSASTAKDLLRPSCPALFRHKRDNPPEAKRQFDYGSAAHKALLGVGPRVELFDAPDWKTKKAQDWAKACRAEGVLPILTCEQERIDAMVAALRAHPFAWSLFVDGQGDPEVSAFWHDPTFGVDRRCRFDWLPHTDGGRLVIPDYKTTISASPATIGSTIAKYRYHMSAAWYVDMAHGLGLAEDIAFVLVFQEKTAPYLVTVAEIDADGMRMGRGLADAALQTFAQCTATDTWPGYTDDVALVSLPTWAHYEFHEITEETS